MNFKHLHYFWVAARAGGASPATAPAARLTLWRRK